MAQQVAQVEALQGQARNPVGGGTQPHTVVNLVPHRLGGLTPFGRRTRLQRDGSDVSVPPSSALVGYDETGVASFVEDANIPV